jgi:hypothetical protein
MILLVCAHRRGIIIASLCVGWSCPKMRGEVTVMPATQEGLQAGTSGSGSLLKNCAPVGFGNFAKMRSGFAALSALISRSSQQPRRNKLAA